MRIQIAVLLLIAAVVLAALALKANISAQPDTKPKDTTEELPALSSGQIPPSMPAQTTPGGIPAATEVAPGQTKDASLSSDNASTQPVAPTKPVVLKESYKQVGDKAVNVQELLGQARAALGGTAKLNEVVSLSASAKMRRYAQKQEQAGTVELDFLLPDKFKKKETLSLLAGIEVTLVKALNGDQVWTDSQTSSGNAQVMVSRPNSGDSPTTQLQDLRTEFTRYVIAFLMTAPPSLSVEFSYVGEAEAPDGRADVLDAKGANGFAVRLFLDKQTHRPLMMSYRGVAPRNAMSSSVSGATKADIDKIVKEAQAKAAVRQEAEINLSFSDYRAVNGIYFPHLITKAVGGKTIEEWQLTRYKINPLDLKAQKFEKK